MEGTHGLRESRAVVLHPERGSNPGLDCDAVEHPVELLLLIGERRLVVSMSGRVSGRTESRVGRARGRREGHDGGVLLALEPQSSLRDPSTGTFSLPFIEASLNLDRVSGCPCRLPTPWNNGR